MPNFGSIPSSSKTSQIIDLAQDVASSNSTNFQNVTGLAYPVVANVTYRCYAILLYTTSAATIGLRVSVSGPAMTHCAYLTRTPVTVGGSLTTVDWVNGASALDTGTASTSSMNTTAGNILVLEGILRPSAPGTVQLRFAPETATANGIVIKAGSTLEWW